MAGIAPVKLFILTFLFHYAYSLDVAPDSQCSDLCIDKAGPLTNTSDPFASRTFTTDLVCEDSQLNGTEVAAVGRKWQQCVSCEASSDTSSLGINSDNETDVFWFMYNIRYNFVWCVFGYPTNNETTTAASTCGETCNAILDPMTNKLFTESMSNRYEYCMRYDNAFKDHASNCQQCLEKVEGASILANYIKALLIACEQRPEMGKPLDIGFNIFAVSSPMSTRTSATISTPSPTSTTDSDQNKSNSHLSIGVTVGIGVGVGVGGAILLTAAGLFLWRRRQLTRGPNPGGKIECYTLPDECQYKDPKVFESNVFPVELGPGRRHNVPQELEVR